MPMKCAMVTHIISVNHNRKRYFVTKKYFVAKKYLLHQYVTISIVQISQHQKYIISKEVKMANYSKALKAGQKMSSKPPVMDYQESFSSSHVWNVERDVYNELQFNQFIVDVPLHMANKMQRMQSLRRFCFLIKFSSHPNKVCKVASKFIFVCCLQ